MAKITYNGMELEEVTKSQIFDQPKKCMVWDFVDPARGFVEKYVVAILKDYNRDTMRPIIAYDGTLWNHCAILPEKPSSHRVTSRELAKWLAQGNGEWCLKNGTGQIGANTNYGYGKYEENQNVTDGVLVRKWVDTDWHEPTKDYLGIE